MADAGRCLIVGLRNPGTRYERTRHNVGAAVVEQLLSQRRLKLRRGRRSLRADTVETSIDGHGVVIALPNTYVNESGSAIGPLVRYYRVETSNVLVIHDDIDLPFGKLRVRFGGSAGGQNGIKSTIESLGSTEFWRLKIGVGRPRQGARPAAHVLSRFARKERDAIAVTIKRAADLAELFVTNGGDSARQRAGELRPDK